MASSGKDCGAPERFRESFFHAWRCESRDLGALPAAARIAGLMLMLGMALYLPVGLVPLLALYMVSVLRPSRWASRKPDVVPGGIPRATAPGVVRVALARTAAGAGREIGLVLGLFAPAPLARMPSTPQSRTERGREAAAREEMPEPAPSGDAVFTLFLAWVFLLGVQLPTRWQVRFAPSDAVLALALGVAVLSGRARMPPKKAVLVLGAVLAVLAMGTLVAFARTRGSVPAWTLLNKDFGAGVLVGSYLFVLWAARGSEGVRRAVACFVAGAVVTSVGALAIALWTPALAHAWGVIAETHVPGLRFSGFLQNPNAYGIYIGSALALYWAALAGGQGSARIGAYAVSVFLGACSGLAESRSAWLSILAAAVVVIAFVPRRLPVVAAGLISSVLFMSSLPLAVATYLLLAVGKLRSAVPGGGFGLLLPAPGIVAPPIRFAPQVTEITGVMSRRDIAELAFRLFRARPLSGIGLGMYTEHAQKALGIPQTIHNTALWFLTEMGIIGLFALALVVLYFGSLSLRLALDRTGGQGLAVGILAALVALAVFSLANEAFYQRTLWLMFGMVSVLRPTHGLRSLRLPRWLGVIMHWPED